MHSSNSGKTRPPQGLTTPPVAADAAPEALKEEKILTVRYSLPEMLEELKHERAAGSLGMERLHQAQITKLFQNNLKPRPRRGKTKH
ncbi:hypothetical protein [Nibricoccus sp. IMCC34717]|uniref:hypothetical protein n=1 Tax=Nibricoccus sp. IMCC34717 TaxID=3034021 RepID=UPI00384BBD36